jgi:hypothetical protein
LLPIHRDSGCVEQNEVRATGHRASSHVNKSGVEDRLFLREKQSFL